MNINNPALLRTNDQNAKLNFHLLLETEGMEVIKIIYQTKLNLMLIFKLRYSTP